MALDPGRVRVKLDPDPDDWELTGAPPEFVAGLDIADPEFEDWIRDQRAVFAERLEAAPPPARLAAGVAVMVAEPPAAVEDAQPSIAVMPLTLRERLARRAADRRRSGDRRDRAAHPLPPARRHRLQLHLRRCRQGLPARELGSRLGARYVTQGVLWLSPSRMRLTFDLILTETEKVVWSHDFDRTWDDLFEVQREVAGAVASGMMVEIEYRERTRVRARDPSSLDAYALWLRGLDDMLSYDRQRCQDGARLLLPRRRGRRDLCARALGDIEGARLPLDVPLGRASRGGAGRGGGVGAPGGRRRRPRPRRPCRPRLGRRSTSATTTGRSTPTSRRST